LRAASAWTCRSEKPKQLLGLQIHRSELSIEGAEIKHSVGNRDGGKNRELGISPVVVKDVVYVGSTDGHRYALD
jgi:hypothetical protein